jgi:hypothetical protein
MQHSTQGPKGSAPPPLQFKVFDLGEVSPAKFESIMQQISEAWGKTVAPLMDDKPKTFKDQFKSDITNAAYRVGSTQLISATKTFLVQYLRKSCSEESKIRMLSEMLDTEIGSALMSVFIGMAVSQIPQLANNPKMQRILKEFRVSGMTTVGNSAVEALMSSMLPTITSALQSLEKTDIKEIEAKSSSSLEEDIVNAELQETPPLVRRS